MSNSMRVIFFLLTALVVCLLVVCCCVGVGASRFPKGMTPDRCARIVVPFTKGEKSALGRCKSCCMDYELRHYFNLHGMGRKCRCRFNKANKKPRRSDEDDEDDDE